MRITIQRVLSASVEVNSNIVGRINKGLLVFLGVAKEDDNSDIEWLVNKLIGLRIFSDENKLMNKNIIDVSGDFLIISQFTLFASCKKGNRPSFVASASPEKANILYLDFIQTLEKQINKTVERGVFGADMKISLINDGPVTINIDSKNKE